MEVGTTATTIISITNVNGSDVKVYRIEFQDESSEYFSAYIDPVPTLEDPLVIPIGYTYEVVVNFSPSDVGYVTAVLEIESSDWANPTQLVSLGGVGVAVQPPPVSIQAILDFFDASVEAGTLQGTGTVPWLREWRLYRLRNMIERAGYFIDNGWIGLACWQLERIYNRCDGQGDQHWNWDFVEGVTCAELNAMILQLMADLGCF